MPTQARPTYNVAILGRRFGDTKGKVKIGKRLVDGEFGKIVSWSDTKIVIKLAPATYWSNLPRTFKVMVKPVGADYWSNWAKLYVSWGGGGTTY